jgi:hypothetical protein
MTWTTQRPTMSGWYWRREADHSTGMIVQVDTLTGRMISSGTDEYRLLKEIPGGEWFGPLEQPS